MWRHYWMGLGRRGVRECPEVEIWECFMIVKLLSACCHPGDFAHAWFCSININKPPLRLHLLLMVVDMFTFLEILMVIVEAQMFCVPVQKVSPNHLNNSLKVALVCCFKAQKYKWKPTRSCGGYIISSFPSVSSFHSHILSPFCASLSSSQPTASLPLFVPFFSPTPLAAST